MILISSPVAPALTTPSAHVITTDAKALAVATSVARLTAHGAAERDARHTLPCEQLEVLSGSGLLGITVPRGHGGADVSVTTLIEVFRLLAVADPNVARITQSHMVYLDLLRHHSTPDQRRIFFAEALAGKRFANAHAEPAAAHPLDVRTRLARDGAGFRLRGMKGSTTGALLAHWFGVLARDDEDRLRVAYIPADAPGVTVIDDWAGRGQRTTASGTVQLTWWRTTGRSRRHNCTVPWPGCCTRRSTQASLPQHSTTPWSSSAPAAPQHSHPATVPCSRPQRAIIKETSGA